MLRLACVSLVMLAFASGCFYFPLGSGSRSRNPFEISDEQRKSLFPERLTHRDKLEGEVRVARVRVYADQEHRAQVPRWRQRFAEVVDGANQVLIPELGVRLEIVEARPWTRQAPGPRLAMALEDLLEHDPGDDVAWVIGLVSALSSITTEMHELGNAHYLGKHMILRGYSDLEQRKALGELGTEEIFAARKAHLQIALLLHEIGHTLGALHTLEDGAIMNPYYRTDTVAFVQENAALMRVVVAARMAPPDERGPEAEARALQAHLDGRPRWPGWMDEEYEAMLRWLAELVTGAPQGSAGASSASKDGMPEDLRRLRHEARKLEHAGRVDEALALYDNLIAAYPGRPELHLDVCQIWLAKQGTGENATRHCQRVGELDPENLDGELRLARAHVKAMRPADAHAALAPVIARLAARQGTPDAPLAEAWRHVLDTLRAMDAVTWVEDALAAAPAGPDADEARAWATATRRRYGLPPRATRHRIAPDQEPGYLAEVRAVLALGYEQKLDAGRKRAHAALARFPDAPGLLGALCDLEVRAGRFDAAHGRCARALAGYAEASWPRYLLGIIELRRKRNQAGIAHLNQAVAMDPDLRQAYHALYQAYVRVKDLDGQERVRAAYYQRFGVAIPMR